MNMHEVLKLEPIVETIATLEKRIDERLPASGLSEVCHELWNTARGAEQRIVALTRPNLVIRSGVILALAGFVALLLYSATTVEWAMGKPDLSELIQVTEALINDIVLMGAAVFFLVTIEKRAKRKSALSALHELRSIAHMVDMHQLTKDPSAIRTGYIITKSSPDRNMNEFELQRYLDYCSEMFSLIGKIAVLYSEHLPDAEIVSASNDVEALCTGLSRKVWQKMVFLNQRNSRHNG